MKMNTIILFVLMVLIVMGAFSSCAKTPDSTASTTSSSTTTSKMTTTATSSSSATSTTQKVTTATAASTTKSATDGNYILDTSFSDGVTVFSPIKPPTTYSGKLTFGKNVDGKSPVWILTQWNSLYNIIKTPGKRVGNTYQYANKNKTFALSDDGMVTLIINASQDYLQPRKTAQDPWAHLYLEQRYSQPRSLGKFKKVNVTYNFVIPFCKNYTPAADYNSNIHASIGVFYLILGDINPSSPGYGDFINFCMPLFDDRVDIPKKSWFMDSGTDPNAVTNKMIYTMDGSVLYSSPTGNGKWHSVNLDIMPYIKDAFNIARNNNCMQKTNFSDVGLSSFFFGFENPGMFDTELQIKNMSITTK